MSMPIFKQVKLAVLFRLLWEAYSVPKFVVLSLNLCTLDPSTQKVFVALALTSNQLNLAVVEGQTAQK